MKKSINEIGRDFSAVAVKLSEELSSIAGERVGFSLMVYLGEKSFYVGNVPEEKASAEMVALIRCWNERLLSSSTLQ